MAWASFGWRADKWRLKNESTPPNRKIYDSWLFVSTVRDFYQSGVTSFDIVHHQLKKWNMNPSCMILISSNIEDTMFTCICFNRRILTSKLKWAFFCFISGLLKFHGNLPGWYQARLNPRFANCALRILSRVFFNIEIYKLSLVTWL